jgi:large repetitive protein
LLVKAQTNQRDANTSNDVAARAIQLLAPNHPDLVVSQVTAPVTGTSGSEIEVNWQVKNQGNLPINVNTWSDRIFLSRDTVFDNSDRLLGAVSHTGTLNQNGIYTNTAKVRLPEEITGDYYLFVDTDYNKQVFEFVYDDNNATSTTTPTTISLKPVPDLQVNSVTADITGEPGENIKVNWQVSNTGNAAATGSWNDYVYLSPDGTLNNAIAQKSVPRAASLAINSNYQASTEFTLPANLADGNYRIVVVTDASHRVFEREGENNNLGVAANLTKVNHADLIPTLINAPTTGNSGTNVTLKWSVANQGTTATSSSWQDRVYLSDNNTFEANQDRLFGEFAHTDELAVGANKPVELNTKLPVDLSGDKYILIVSDGSNQIKEAAGESNNVIANPIKIELSPYADLAVTNVTAPSQTIADPARVKVN